MSDMDMAIPRLSHARPRQTCTAILHAQCLPDRDARSLAALILAWWQPIDQRQDQGTLTDVIAASILPMMRQCRDQRQDMTLVISMHHSGWPQLRIAHITPPIERSTTIFGGRIR